MSTLRYGIIGCDGRATLVGAKNMPEIIDISVDVTLGNVQKQLPILSEVA
jgi:hypothetical protein